MTTMMTAAMMPVAIATAVSTCVGGTCSRDSRGLAAGGADCHRLLVSAGAVEVLVALLVRAGGMPVLRAYCRAGSNMSADGGQERRPASVPAFDYRLPVLRVAVPAAVALARLAASATAARATMLPPARAWRAEAQRRLRAACSSQRRRRRRRRRHRRRPLSATRPRPQSSWQQPRQRRRASSRICRRPMPCATR